MFRGGQSVSFGHKSANKSKYFLQSPKVFLFQNVNGLTFVSVKCFATEKKEKKQVPPVPVLVTVPWLQEQIKFGKVKVVDASWGTQHSNWRDEFVSKRIPGSVFFDVEKISDATKEFPHMLPKPIPYEKAMEELGLTHKDHLILYDRSGQFVASARVWWTLKTYGHEKVSILVGGLGQWEKEKGQIESGQPPQTRPKGRYKARFKKELIADMRTVQQLSEGRGQIVDARSSGRFNGTEPEPRPNVRSGNIPGSVNIPFGEILVPIGSGPEKTFAPQEKLEEIFRNKGINTENRVITTCGSGVTAAVLALGLHVAGKNNWSLYDGSWSEYGKIRPPQ